MIVIASWPVARIHHWTALLTARAIENQCYVVGVNRVGNDPSLKYKGHSCIVGPGGEMLLDCGESEGLFNADIDLEVVSSLREKLPFLADMRPEFLCQ